MDLLDELSHHVDKDNGNKDKCKSWQRSFRCELRMISNKENNSLYNQEISQPTKPSITKKVMLNILHTNDMDNNNLSSQTP